MNKKDDHVNLAHEFAGENKRSQFDDLKFVHNSFSELSMSEIDISTSLAGLELDCPFFINAMTGGSKMTGDINRDLSIISREVGIPMASGSLSVALKNEELLESFSVIRKENPKGIIFTNLGAEHSLESAKKAIKTLKADGLQIHLNTPQELVMPEGDRDFSNWISSIENMAGGLDLPIIIKEVGFGMSRETIGLIYDMGVDAIDLGGYGGTNFAKIENFRRDKNKYDYLEDFGQSTVISLLEAGDYIDKVDIVASGGIRNPMDIVKSLALGAKAVGVAGTILSMLLDQGLESTIEELNSWKYEIALIMTLLGKRNISELREADLIISGRPREWCQAREINFKSYANRTRDKS